MFLKNDIEQDFVEVAFAVGELSLAASTGDRIGRGKKKRQALLYLPTIHRVLQLGLPSVVGAPFVLYPSIRPMLTDAAGAVSPSFSPCPGETSRCHLRSIPRLPAVKESGRMERVPDLVTSL